MPCSTHKYVRDQCVEKSEDEHIKVSRRDRKGKHRDGSADVVQCWLWAPANRVAVEGQVASLTWPKGQRGKVSIPAWMVGTHCSWAQWQGWDVVQRCSSRDWPAAFFYQRKNKASDIQTNTSPIAHLAPADLVAKEVSDHCPHLAACSWSEGQKQHCSLSGWYIPWLNPVEKRKPQMSEPASLTHSFRTLPLLYSQLSWRNLLEAAGTPQIVQCG